MEGIAGTWREVRGEIEGNLEFLRAVVRRRRKVTGIITGKGDKGKRGALSNNISQFVVRCFSGLCYCLQVKD